MNVCCCVDILSVYGFASGCMRMSGFSVCVNVGVFVYVYYAHNNVHRNFLVRMLNVVFVP